MPELPVFSEIKEEEMYYDPEEKAQQLQLELQTQTAEAQTRRKQAKKTKKPDPHCSDPH